MKLQAITLEAHSNLRWRRPASYHFAAKEAVVPLVGSELSKAVLCLAIAFVAQGDAFAPMAVLGCKPAENLFVGPDGYWLAPYIPASIRTYPFYHATSEHGKKVLCIDTDSGLVGEAGEPFFAEAEPTQTIRDILNHLTQAEQSRQATALACAALHKHKLIVPWQITVQGQQGSQHIEGLFKIDEVALNQLPGAALQELMQAGALAIAYCQLLSMQHLQRLGELAQARARVSAPPLPLTNAGKDLDLSFLNQGDTMNFTNY